MKEKTAPLPPPSPQPTAEFFRRIPPSFPEQAVFRRLGRRASTRISPEEEENIRRIIDQTADLMTLQGALRRIPIRWEDSRTLLLETPEDGEETEAALSIERIQSRHLSRFLAGCREILLLGATAGPAPAAEIQRLTREGAMDRAVVVDAAAGEIVDAALGWLQARKGRELLREGLTVDPRRFSPGYGDLSLEVQSLFFDLLSMTDLGVRMTESRLMLPEKSVLAVTALRSRTDSAAADSAAKGEEE